MRQRERCVWSQALLGGGMGQVQCVRSLLSGNRQSRISALSGAVRQKLIDNWHAGGWIKASVMVLLGCHTAPVFSVCHWNNRLFVICSR